MYIIDPNKFKSVLKAKGYRSIGELAKTLKIHRNTVHYYLSGNGVFPENLEKILTSLDLKPSEILVNKEAKEPLMAAIAPLVDNLYKKFPDATFVMFGSRAKGTASKYSDWDIGVFAAEGMSHEYYREILKYKDELTENLPFFVDVINLNRADADFLRQISKNWVFLTGRVADWLALQKKV